MNSRPSLSNCLADFGRDFHYSLRTLGKKPGFVAVALVTLGLGIGATTLMFTLIEGVLLKPLPYASPESLVAVQSRTAPFGNQNFAYPDFLDVQRESRSLAPVAGYVYDWGTLSEPGDPENVDFREVTSNLFPTLGVTALRGRLFSIDEDRPGGTPVAILSYSLWQRRFGGASEAVGRSVVLNGSRYQVVGILPASFRLEGEPDLLTAIGQDTAAYLRNRRARPVSVIARLKAGVTVGQAQIEIGLIGRRLAAQYPDTNGERAFVAEPLRADVGDAQSTLWLLLGAVTVVLLIACVNIASLLLARASSRQREMAMRSALGAGRGRLIRQCLTESTVLGIAGGLVGIAIAFAGLRPFVAFWPGSLPRAEEVGLDWRVLLFALGISLLSGLLFGLAPALRSPSGGLDQALRASGRSVIGGSRRMHSGFVIAEIALAVVLLVSAGMLGRTMLRLSSLAPGIDIHNVLVSRMRISPAIVSDPARLRTAWQEAIEQAGRVPGVRSVALVDTVPMRQGNNQLAYWPSSDLPPASQRPLALATSVTPDYLTTMGLPLREGRFFDAHDRLDSQPVVVIDEVLARQAFAAKDPIGAALWIPDMASGAARVIGVVGHVRHWGLAGDDQAQVRAQIYYPFAQVPDGMVRRWSEVMSMAVRTSVPPQSIVEPLRHAIRGAGGDQVLYEVRTMEDLAAESLARQRFLMLLFGVFAMVALLLAAIGLYGVMSYLTGERVPEIGVRMALGASRGEVIWLVLRQSLRMIVPGLVAGAVAAAATDRVLRRYVEGMQSTSAATFALMLAVLAVTALVASFVPARRASRIDPLAALR